MYLLVRADLASMDPLVTGLIFSSNKDIFKGVTYEKDSLIGYYVFQSDNKERLEALAYIFNKVKEKHKIKTKSLVKLQKTLRKKVASFSIE